MPLNIAQLIFPDFDPTEAEKEKSAKIQGQINQMAKGKSDKTAEQAQKEKNLADFFDEEERRINDPEYGAKKRIEEQAAFEKALTEYRTQQPSEVITSVKGDIESLFKAVPAKGAAPEKIDLSEDIDIDIEYEDAPPTVKDIRKSA